MLRPLITAAISLGVLIYFIVICVGGLEHNYVESSWKMAPAIVLDPDIALFGKENRQRKNEGIEQVLNYEYTIAGTKYRSNSVAREAFVDVNKYPEGKIIDIYYNPKDLSDSVIVRTSVPQHYLYGFIGSCVFVIFVILYYLIRDLKALRKSNG